MGTEKINDLPGVGPAITEKLEDALVDEDAEETVSEFLSTL